MNENWGIRVSTSESLGMGHLMRSLELAKELKNVRLYIDPTTKSNVEKFYHKDLLIEEESIVSINKSVEDIKNNKITGLIIDHYKIPKKEIESSCSYGHLAVIDDFFDYWKKPTVIISSLSININNNIPKEKLIYGYDKIIIPKAAHYKIEKKSNAKLIKNSILIQFGAMDNNNLTSRFLNAVLSIKNTLAKITVVLSERAPHRKQVIKLLNNFNNGKTLEVKNFNELEWLYNSHEVLFGSAGVSLLERIYLGFYSFILSHNSCQDINAKAAGKLNLGKNIGRADLLGDKELKNLILNCIENKNKYRKNLDSDIIDGKGAKRIVSQLIKIHKNNTHLDI